VGLRRHAGAAGSPGGARGCGGGCVREAVRAVGSAACGSLPDP
jgi:hypothetical protein